MEVSKLHQDSIPEDSEDRWALIEDLFNALPAPHRWPKRWWSPRRVPLELISEWRVGPCADHELALLLSTLDEHQAREVVMWTRWVALSQLNTLHQPTANTELASLIQDVFNAIIESYPHRRLEWEGSSRSLEEWTCAYLRHRLSELSTPPHQRPQPTAAPSKGVFADLGDERYPGMGAGRPDDDERYYIPSSFPDAVPPDDLPSEHITYAPLPEDLIPLDIDDDHSDFNENYTGAPPPPQAPSPEMIDPEPELSSSLDEFDARPKASSDFGQPLDLSEDATSLLNPIPPPLMSAPTRQAPVRLGAPAPVEPAPVEPAPVTEQMKRRSKSPLPPPPKFPEGRARSPISQDELSPEAMSYDIEISDSVEPSIESSVTPIILELLLPPAPLTSVEKSLGDEVGRPGIIERSLGVLKRTTRLINITIGLRCLVVIHILDMLWGLISDYVTSIFKGFMALRSARKMIMRRATGRLVSGTSQDLKRAIFSLDHLLCISDRAHTLTADSKETQRDEDALLLSVLQTRARLDDLSRDLNFITTGAMTSSFWKALKGWLWGLIPNPYTLWSFVKDSALILFRLRFKRREVLKLYLEFKGAAFDLIASLELHLNHEADERRVNQDIRVCRERLNRLLTLTLTSRLIAQPHRWSALDCIEEFVYQELYESAQQERATPDRPLDLHLRPTEAALLSAEADKRSFSQRRGEGRFERAHPLVGLSLNLYMLKLIRRELLSSRGDFMSSSWTRKEWIRETKMTIADHRVHQKYARSLRERAKL